MIYGMFTITVLYQHPISHEPIGGLLTCWEQLGLWVKIPTNARHKHYIEIRSPLHTDLRTCLPPALIPIVVDDRTWLH